MATTTVTVTETRTEPMTADTILRLFPDIDTSSEALSGHDEEQIRLMDEVCIVLDDNDMPTGSNLPDAIEGAKRAAQRKLEHELGIKKEQVSIEKFRFLTRIHYKAPSDGKWGEHEIDYILFIKTNVDLKPNPNEVQATQYVSADKLKKLFEDPSLKFTPWFKLICNSMLFEWWASLDSGLEKYTNEQEIRRML
ncbi:Isopentenyl-diphosphate Delta-isomerase [Metarhizium anisopliae]|nr:Isopentenyl-diphosphate Delta-isomerase [Metarhizium anisopliae]